MKIADAIKKTDELLETPCYLIDIFPQGRPQKVQRWYAVAELFQSSREELNRKFTRLLLKLYCYYDFWVLAWVTEAEAVENPDVTQLTDLINHCFEGEWKSRDYINIILPECNSMIILNGDDLYLQVYNPDEKLKALVSQLAQSEGLAFCRAPELCETQDD